MIQNNKEQQIIDDLMEKFKTLKVSLGTIASNINMEVNNDIRPFYEMIKNEIPSNKEINKIVQQQRLLELDVKIEYFISELFNDIRFHSVNLLEHSKEIHKRFLMTLLDPYYGVSYIENNSLKQYKNNYTFDLQSSFNNLVSLYSMEVTFNDDYFKHIDFDNIRFENKLDRNVKNIFEILLDNIKNEIQNNKASIKIVKKPKINTYRLEDTQDVQDFLEELKNEVDNLQDQEMENNLLFDSELADEKNKKLKEKKAKILAITLAMQKGNLKEVEHLLSELDDSDLKLSLQQTYNEIIEHDNSRKNHNTKAPKIQNENDNDMNKAPTLLRNGP